MRTKSRAIVPKPPADYEEVKRRFIRQNRELAKHNSTQALRIRTLDIEVSKLSSENFALGEKVRRLQHELDSARSYAATAAIANFKDEMQAKITELNNLVAGIEGPQDDGERDERRGESKRMEGPWRERQPLTEIMRDNQMPTITEDKLYPRRTLGADEIQAIRLSDHSSNESPDIGPPPVARFDYEDPVKQMSPSVSRMSPDAAEDGELPASLSVNLETRRKRRDGQPKLEIRRHSILAQSPVQSDSEASSILRTGAKRKLADRDIDKPIKPPSKDDFTFSRKSVSGDKLPILLPTRVDEAEASPEKANASPRPSRRVLGDKSVNMSPRKQPATIGKDSKEGHEKAAAPKPREPRSQLRSRRASAIPVPAPQDEAIPTVEIAPPTDPVTKDPPPKTPAAAPDLFSPTPSEPSVQPAESRDTPPPIDLRTLGTAAEGGIRPTRRARSAVNYAEPNLVAKLRRPGKQMVDALSGLQDPRAVMNASGERKTSARAGGIKVESEDDDVWKSLPPAVEVGESMGSPPRDKVRGDVAPADIRDQQAATEKPPSASSATISSLMAASSKGRTTSASVASFGRDVDAAAKMMEELDLYEFKDSSSPADVATANKTALSSAPRPHRRHSSQRKEPVLTQEASSGTMAGSSDSASLPLTHGRSERAASRRRSMMV